MKSVLRYANLEGLRCVRKTFPFSNANVLRPRANYRFSSTDKKVMVTTPIFYVNSSPHLGHLYTCTLSDALARYHRLRGKSVHFMTGTDEHGLKIQQAAEKNGFSSPLELCDKFSQEFKELCRIANISYDDFIRTTQPRHYEAVSTLWNRLMERGYIYLGKYEGWYCVSDEAFLTDEQVKDVVDAQGTKIKVSIESGHKVDWVVEENYMFKLSEFSKPLLNWLEENPDLIIPRSRATEIKLLLEKGLPDLSVSRLSNRIKWAIPVPDDPNHTIYVWLDALTNYLTSAGYPSLSYQKTWPADYHIIGKDIVKFHAVYWPAFLMAASLPLPKKIIVHAHWLVNRTKMSKSLGNVVKPQEVIDLFGLDCVRFFLLCEGGLAEDGDFSTDRLFLKLKGELADNFGNLIGRCTSTQINPGNRLPKNPKNNRHYVLSEQDKEFMTVLENLRQSSEPFFEDSDLPKAVSTILEAIHIGNRYFQNSEPWKIAKILKQDSSIDKKKQEELKEQLDTVLYLTLEAIRLTSLLLQPIMPTSTQKILDRLGVNAEERSWNHAQFGLHENVSLGDSGTPFKAFQIPVDYKLQQ